MEIKVFNNHQFGEVRVLRDEAGEPWFVAKDVCDILGYADVEVALRKIEDDEKLTRKIYASGQLRKMWIINESGLFTLILRSNKPQAKKFRKWVTSEVLPAIRKHGLYATPDTIDKIISNPDFGIKLLSELKQERQRRQQLENEVIELKPKAFFAEVVSNSKDAILVRDFAKLISNFKLFVSTSTGTYHVASLVGTSTMTFFGDSLFASSKRWKSVGDESKQQHFMLPIDENKRTEIFNDIKKILAFY